MIQRETEEGRKRSRKRDKEKDSKSRRRREGGRERRRDEGNKFFHSLISNAIKYLPMGICPISLITLVIYYPSV